MRITSVNIPEDFMKKGLSKINIDRLGENIIIAGKNGAGKTRLLNIIFDNINKHIMTEDVFKKLEKILETSSL